MKKLKHSKYKNTGILFEMLVRKLTSETLTSDKSITIDIIKKYFGRNTELSKELQLYNALIKENHKSEARALDFMRTVKGAHKKLNHNTLNRQKYNLVKEISENFVFENMSKIHINNYKELASIYMLFEYDESENPKQIMQCKNFLLEHAMPKAKIVEQRDPVLESFVKQDKNVRLLTYKLLVDKFNILTLIVEILREHLGYSVYYKIVKATDYGLPQHRPRTFIVGFRNEVFESGFQFPPKVPLENREDAEAL